MRGPRVSTLRCRLAFLAVALLVVGVAFAQVPGRNVNMVSGTEWPGGDPFLQRQNEPSVAVSTRNPMHLLAGANDYRTVDLPGLPDDKMTGDAWLGVFMSSDGGATWKSTLVPGYRQEANSTSPLHGFDAGADPVVRAGPHGLFYYSGIVFDRDNPVLEARARAAGHGVTAGVGTSTSAVFVARYIDNNVKENGNPIGYLGTTVVASNDDPNVFLDKPWLAVDMPRFGAGTCAITQTLGGQTVTQTIPVGNVYVTYSQFTGKVSDGTTLGTLMFSRSTDCGATWSAPIMISGTNHINQGATIALDPRTGVVYVVWRRFAWPLKPNTPTERDAILIARSVDRGRTFSAPEVVGEFQPFDQGTGGQQFRTNSYPTAGVDRFGRVLVAYSTRGVQQPDGDARIVLTWARYPSRLWALFRGDEDDGTETPKIGDRRPTWTTPTPVDPDVTRRGHQVMPSMLVTGLRVQIAWVDLQEDHTWGVYAPLPTGQWQEGRELSEERQNSPGHVFNAWVSDSTVQYRRHSADIWVAQADPGDRLNFTVRRASSYKAGARWDKSDTVQQLQFNPPNLPLFRQGTAAFWSDYLDLGAQPLEQKARLRWRHSLQPPSAHVVFTDNRDVRAPTNGDWSDYTPPRSPALHADSIFSPGTPTPTCIDAHPENAGMRNQNIYTARVTQGLYVAAPGNAKPLGRIQRAFVVNAENNTYDARTFRMSIASQPAGGTASFKQFAPLSQVDVTIGPRSSVSRTVYVSSTDPRALVTVDVKEVSGGVIVPPIQGGLQGTTALNPDSTNPDMMNPDMMNPDMMNPDVLSAEVYTPDMMNPDMMNPDMMNPDMMNPDMMNPDMMNPDMMNPDMMNPDMMNITPSGDVNATMLNPDMMNPDMMNADLTNAALTDTAWTLTNNGNTTAAYDVKLLLRGSSQVPDGFKTQLLLYRTYLTPVARDCELTEETQNVLIASVPNPPFGHVGDTVLFSPTDGTLGHTTLWLAPGESAKITLRVLDPDRHDLVIFDPVSEVTPAVAPQPVDTISAAGGKTTPDVVTTSPIVFRTRPVATPIGGYVTPPVEVLVEDDSGSPIAGATVTLSLASNPGGATLHGGTATTGSDGVATFSTLWLDRLGNGYRLQATAGTRTSNDSGSFNIVPLVVTTTADAGPGSLRQAIENANRNAGYTDAISFNVPGGGTQTIALTSALPAIADALTIDGTTQPGYAGVPLVRLDGVGAGPSASGLVAQGTSVTIRGVAITRFSGDGVRLETATGGLVEDSYIGTDGMADLGNGGDGLVIQSGSGNVVRGCTVSGNGRAGVLLWGTQDDDVVGNKIGTNAGGNAAIPNDSSGIVLRVSSRQRIGTGAPGSGNVISGNAVYGIGLFGPGAVSDVLIAGNRIGTNAAGTAALPNGLGVYVFETTGSGITIGGPTPDARNLISGNSSHGIYLDTTRQVAVAGNYVGTDASGAAGLGNGHSGITIGSAQDNRIGGTAAAEGNTIAFNGGAGIGAGGSGSGNAFLGNRMFSNGGLGIDLAPPGPNPNDVGDGDTGPNDLLNYPVLASAVDSGTQTTVSGSVDIGVPGATVTIQFFHNAACDPSGYGEGQTLVGQTTIATGGDGTATFVAGLPGGLGPGYITATTVLSPTNTTSEFSACRSVTTGGTLGFLVQPTASPIGGYVAPPVKVLVQDGSGAAVPSAAVTLSFASNPGGATLNGGTATTDSSGIATFSELWLDRLGSGFRLRATVATYPVEDSATFDVTPLVITSIADAGAGSLRAAIENANRNAGYADAISFDIPGAGPHTIAPAAELPLITDPVVIDGTTQPGFAGAPLIELSGLSAGPARGLVIGAGGSTVRGLAIGGFQGEGIWLTGASGNVLQGNFIGTDASGTVARANQDGILVTASSGNLIGGTSAADRNVISGNLSMGVKIDTALSIGNQVVGNFIGTDATGALALGNGQSGVLIADAPGNTVGGTASGAGNVISGNNASGILIQLAGATGNQILGNRIGTTASGMAAVGNGLSGISVFSASNTIGGTTNAARNVISGNGVVGVWLVGASATGNQVQGNFVGTDATGSAVVGNGGIGIYVGGPGNTVGGTSVGSGNVISGNLRGVGLVGADAAGNVVQGNRIGTDSLGMTTLGNTAQGVFISSDAHGNTVGASSSAARNIISGNSGFGVEFSSTAGTGNEILGNYIGVAADGSTPRANAAGGVRADVGPNRIGDLAPGAGNVISGNGGRGVWLPSGDDHVVQGNLIGTNSQGDAAVPNATTGITIEGATARHTLRGNVVSGNVGAGVEILGGAHDIIVVDNKIGTNLAGAAALGNGSDGVRLSSGAHDNSIGSHTAGFGNLISGNGVTGVTLAGTSANTVLGNRIGTDASGTAAIPNQGFGVSLAQSSSDTIGGEAAGAGNLISGNGGGGVAVGPMTGGAVVSGNRIGTNADGTSAIGNAGEGVFVTGPDTSVVMIKANVVSGNSRTGIDIVNGAHHNSVVANRVGTNLSGSAAMPNGSTSSGVRVSGDAHSNTIGGAGAGEGNLISGNYIGITLATTHDNTVQGNRIGTNGDGMSAIPNTVSGIFLDSTAGGAIGGTGAGQGNLVSGNGECGISVWFGGVTGALIAGNRIGTNADGTAAVGNTLTGICMRGTATSDNTVSGNLLSGNGRHGLEILSGPHDNTIVLNKIGTNVTGTGPLGNAQAGVILSNPGANVIGALTPALGNTIAFNGTSGIAYFEGTAPNVFGANRIHSNGWLGIGFAGDAVTANDPQDTDTGPNDLLNFPVLTSAVGSTTGTTVEGTLSSIPGATFAIQVFSNASCDPSGYGEGEVFEGMTTVTTDSPGGNGSFTVTLPGDLTGRFVTATTSTSLTTGGMTSEFSACRSVTSGGTLVFSAQPTTAPIGGYVTPPVQVLVRDETSAPVPGVTVTLSLASNPAGATLHGGTATSDSSGIATLSELWLDRLGGGFSLRATVGTYPPEDSATFDVTPLLVTTIADVGPGSLRAAIENANRNAGYADTISFGIGAGPVVISPASALPALTDPVTLDATSQPGYAGWPIVRLDGSGAGGGSGFTVQASGVTIRGFAITGFTGSGVVLRYATGAVVADNYVGTDGTTALANLSHGISIEYGSANELRDNVVSGNQNEGINLFSTSANSIRGNRIGTNAAGTAALPNTPRGIFAGGGSTDNVIGGPSPTDRNVISGNSQYGVVMGVGAAHNRIEGNYVGTNAAGTAAIANTIGVELDDQDNVVRGNLLSGNGGYGIAFVNAPNTLLENNLIGTSADGAAPIPNSLGVLVFAAPGSLMRNNVVSGNSPGQGMWLQPANHLTIVGNKIGTRADGAVALPNAGVGIMAYGCVSSTIGGAAPGDGNLVSGNLQQGIVLQPDANGLVGCVVEGNLVGTNLAGSAALPNGGTGIEVTAVSAPAAPMSGIAIRGNLLSGNGGVGLILDGAHQVIASANRIGTNAAGDAAIPNEGVGIALSAGAGGNTIGGALPGEGNVISGNGSVGVDIANSSGNQFWGNWIGTNDARTHLGNGGSGVTISGTSTTNSIGGPYTGMGNAIAFNTGNGVQDTGGPTGNQILGNSIFSNGLLGILDNGMLDPPALTSADTSGGTTTVSGALHEPDYPGVFWIEFFRSPNCDASGSGEGEQLMGHAEVTTDGAGNGIFSVALPAISGGVVTATATSSIGTSGFSACLVPDLALVVGDLREVASAEAAYQSAAGGWYGTLNCLLTPTDCIVDYPPAGPVFISADLASLATRAGYVRAFSPGPEVSSFLLLVPGLEEFAYTAVPENGFGPGFCIDNSGAIYTNADGTATAVNGRCTSGTPLP